MRQAILRLVVGVGAPLLLACVLGGCQSAETTSDGPDDPSESSQATSPTGETGTDTPTGDSGQVTKGECRYASHGEAAREVNLPPGDVPRDLPTRLILDTNLGAITIDLKADDAPCTVNSIVSLAQQGYFDDTSCHRLTTMGLFSLQCGDPSGTGRGGPGYDFKSEITGKQRYARGTVAMATTPPDSNGSQFFLIYDDSELASKYTVFGEIDEDGLELLDEVSEAGVVGDGIDGEPEREVTITSTELE